MRRAAIALLFLVVTGCGFEKRSPDFECDQQSDCVVGRMCVEGWCVFATADAAPPDAPDAAPADATSSSGR